jgi:nucleoside-diphosphate-sugar epimerase
MNLVTGATGIVGTRLVYDLIKAGARVRAMHRPASDLQFTRSVLNFYGLTAKEIDSIDWFEANLIDIFSLEEILKGVRTVYHAGALVSYHPSDADRLIKTNAEGTANLVNACLKSEVESLCHVSSVAALGLDKKAPTREDTLWKRSQNRSIYGLSKFLAEQEVWRGSAEGLNAGVVNPSVIIGPFQPDKSSGMLLSMLRKGVNRYPSGTIGMVDVRDVSRACLEVIRKRRFNGRYLLNAENLSYRELLTLSAGIFDHDPPKYAIPDWVLLVGGTILKIFPNLSSKISKETLAGAMRKANYDNTKGLELLDGPFISVEKSLLYVKSFLEAVGE